MRNRIVALLGLIFSLAACGTILAQEEGDANARRGNRRERGREHMQRRGKEVRQKGRQWLAKDCPDQAEEYFNAAYLIDLSVDNLSGVADDYNNLGSVAAYRNQYDVAKTYYDKALALYRQLSDPGGESIALGNMATLYLDLKQWEQAEEYLQQARICHE